MDKDFLDWWDLNKLDFFENDDMGIREIAAAAWKAGQATRTQPADGVGELVRAVRKHLDNIYEFGTPTDDVYMDQVEKALERLNTRQGIDARLRTAARALIDYDNNHTGWDDAPYASLFEELEKALLEAEASASNPSDVGNK